MTNNNVIDSLYLSDVTATETQAKLLSKQISAPMVITLSGEIGAGKTTLMRALLRAFGVQSTIKSPTYSLVESYKCGQGFWLHHFDLYRLNDITELEFIGFFDYFTSDAVCCIEWPEKARDILEDVDIALDLELAHQGGRLLKIRALSPRGRCALSDKG